MSSKLEEYRKRNVDFKEYIKDIDDPVLDNAIHWIQDNLLPEDVFSSIDLESWANQSGFKRE